MRAVTASAPAVAVTGDAVITASAALSTTLTAITALMASEAPLAFHDEPPEEVAVASAVATIAARSRADTATDAALTVEPVIVAVDGAAEVVEDHQPADRHRVRRRHVLALRDQRRAEHRLPQREVRVLRLVGEVAVAVDAHVLVDLAVAGLDPLAQLDGADALRGAVVGAGERVDLLLEHGGAAVVASVIDELTISTLANTPASSAAATLTAPVSGLAVEFSRRAVAALETLLEASRPPIALPVALNSADAAESAALEIVAFSCAALSAMIARLVPRTVELRTIAVASAGCSPLKAPAISGSPSSASTALKTKFCDFQPSVLKASTTLMPVSPVFVAARTVASIAAALVALTETAPSSTLWSAVAAAFDSTTLVARMPLTASTVPVP